MRYRCANCTKSFVVSESTALYPQSFCSKGCEVESVVAGPADEDFSAVLSRLGMYAEQLHEVH